MKPAEVVQALRAGRSVVDLGLEATIGALEFGHTGAQGTVLGLLGLEEADELFDLLLKFADFGVHGGNGREATQGGQAR